MIRFTLIITACLLICGCSSTKIPKKLDAEFKTRITSSGLKHFQMQLVPLQPEEPPSPPIMRKQNPSIEGNPRASRPDSAAKKNEQILLAQAEVQISNSGFCREGFWLLDKNLYSRNPFIRGECNDTASSTDRQQFPDTLFKW
ncbi:hypothetical protein [Teredinibacter haidensis]|uniref:hypothetical protein n=1 Tax=Teredinibacter haidensis TaxID=2731755 RepID=UPI00094913B1|nr:hypothetical protein [Teredinibacter haidensis]